jgi:hypothetical protein
VQDFFDSVDLVKLRRIVQPELYPYRVEILQRDLPRPMTDQMTLLLASVLWCGYTLFDSTPMSDPEVKAKAIGTYNVLDRSKQYTREDPRELLRAVNEAWTKIRTLEKESTKKDAAIAELRSKLRRVQIANVALTSIITALAMQGLKFLFQALR